MKYILFLFLLPPSIISKFQSLSPERIAKIKSATVRITIDSSTSVGTGFFIDASGTILTCWHVIKPAIKKNGINKIFVELNTGEKMEAFLAEPNDSFIKDAIVFDFAALVLNQKNRIFPYMSLGNYNNLREGELVYTCGYPLGIPQQFISQGIVSTKYVDTVTYYMNNIAVDKHLRNQTLFDLTLNAGNSGGAIVKIGNNPNDDLVIGIADFIIIPFGQQVSTLKKITHNATNDVQIIGISTMKAYELFSSALSEASNGISGAVSIEHFQQALLNLNKTNKK